MVTAITWHKLSASVSNYVGLSSVLDMKNRMTAGSVLLESDSDINLRPDSDVSVIKNASIYKMLI